MVRLSDRIRTVYPDLTASERRIAELVLASSGLMLGFTATEVAERAGVSAPTVTRFVAKLGIGGFREFRALAREEFAVDPGSPLDLLSRGRDETEGDLDRLVARTLTADSENLSRTYTGIGATDVRDVVAVLAGAERLAFVGLRKNHALAAYAAALFSAVRPGVRALPEAPGMLPDGLLDVGPGDGVVMFTFRRPQRDHGPTARTVRRRGATLIVVGDLGHDPSGPQADHALVCHTGGVGVFDSMVAPMSLINLLFTATAIELGEGAERRLADLEETTTAMGTFRTEGPDAAG